MKTSSVIVRSTVVLILASMAACASSRARSGRGPILGGGGGGGGGGARQMSRVMLDGRFEEWPDKTAAMADADWIYMRVTVEDAVAPIQAAPDTLCLWLDADGDSKTGVTMPAPAAASSLGIDAVIEYSPQDPASPGLTKAGAAVWAADGKGGKAQLSHDKVGLASLPTYASTGYEVRLSRHVDAQAAPALAKALKSGGRAKVLFVLRDRAGKTIGWSDPETFSKPGASTAAPVADVIVPPKPAGAIRIVSYNVLRSKLAKEPQSFARLFQVLNADVILAQEWDADAATATAWFTAIVTGTHPWHARAAAGDVVIVSPHPLAPLGPDKLTLESGEDSAIRFVGATVKTPAGPIAVGSMHLKCCGTAGSPEDKARSAQAEKINAAMKAALGSGPRVRVFGGDVNLVGSRAPLDALCAGLDAEGSNLTPAEPRILGDSAEYTWADPKTDFPPGRLDYLLYSDASADVLQSFILDTRRLSPRALARMGLDAGDSAASDHMPVVIDIRPK